jgi:hypothetical protein
MYLFLFYRESKLILFHCLVRQRPALYLQIQRQRPAFRCQALETGRRSFAIDLCFLLEMVAWVMACVLGKGDGGVANTESKM